MKLTLGFSPCPNDTFIFDALVNKKIDTNGVDVDVVLEDVQTLNKWAIDGKLDVTKISYGVWPLVFDQYALLDSGSALGKGVGPLLIAKRPLSIQEINESAIAIPGKNTTAHMLFSLVYPHATKKRFMLFSDIEGAVLREEVACGVIIHENRFTYAQRGLVKLADLGEAWEEKTQCPIPLGGIVMKKTFDPATRELTETLIRKSVEYSFQHYPALSEYVKEHAQEMEEDVMRKHIDLYVNNYSISLGEDGKKAIDTLVNVYNNINQVPAN